MRGIALLALLAGVCLAGCNPQPEHPERTPAPQSTSALPPLRIIGRGTAQSPVRIGEQAGNRMLYRLQARSYESRSVANVAQAQFQHAQVTFYDKDGTTLEAAAPVATVDEKSRQVVLSGGVHATTSTGLRMTCQTLAYDRVTGLLHGTGNVRITGDQNGSRETLTGNAFTSNVKLTRMVMK
jgi:LPS export ABC transporter protein LptC